MFTTVLFARGLTCTNGFACVGVQRMFEHLTAGCSDSTVDGMMREVPKKQPLHLPGVVEPKPAQRPLPDEAAPAPAVKTVSDSKQRPAVPQRKPTLYPRRDQVRPAQAPLPVRDEEWRLDEAPSATTGAGRAAPTREAPSAVPTQNVILTVVLPGHGSVKLEAKDSVSAAEVGHMVATALDVPEHLAVRLKYQGSWLPVDVSLRDCGALNEARLQGMLQLAKP